MNSINKFGFNSTINMPYPSKSGNHLRARTAKAAEIIHEKEEVSQKTTSLFTCPCPTAWAYQLSGFVMSFFSSTAPNNEEEQWELLFKRIGSSKDPLSIKSEIEGCCEEAIDKYPELQNTGQTTLELFSSCFEFAIIKNDYSFAKKLMEAGVKIKVKRFRGFTFTVDNGTSLNPAIKEVPELFNHLFSKRGFLDQDKNSASLLVALREWPTAVPMLLKAGVNPSSEHLLVALRQMPSAVPLLLQAGVNPSSEHLDEAIRLENEQAIGLFLEKHATPSTLAVESAIKQNDIVKVKKLLDMGAQPPILYDINFILNPKNHIMVGLLTTHGAQFSLTVAFKAIEIEEIELIKKIALQCERLKSKMITRAKKLEKYAVYTALLLLNSKQLPKEWEEQLNKNNLHKIKNYCLETTVKYPELKIRGQTYSEFLSEALGTAVRKEDFTFAHELKEVGVAFELSYFNNLPFTVKGNLNPAFKEMPELFDFLLANRGLLTRDITQDSLLAALREMPSAVELLLEEGVKPSYKHIDEAICQENESTINYCLDKNILPSRDGMKSAILQNNVPLVSTLFNRGVRGDFHTHLNNYAFVVNPDNRMMVRFLLSNGGRFFSQIIDQVIEKGSLEYIRKTYNHISPRLQDYMLKNTILSDRKDALKTLIVKNGVLPRDRAIIHSIFHFMPELIFVLLEYQHFTTTHLNGVLYIIKDGEMAKDLLIKMIEKGIKPDGGSLILAMTRDDAELIKLIQDQGVKEIARMGNINYDSSEQVVKKNGIETVIHFPKWFYTSCYFLEFEDSFRNINNCQVDEWGSPLKEDRPPALIDW